MNLKEADVKKNCIWDISKNNKENSTGGQKGKTKTPEQTN